MHAAARIGSIVVTTALLATALAAAGPARPAAAERALVTLGFRTPSGNVSCAGHAYELRCHIRATAAAIPRPSRCEGDWTKGFSLLPRGGAGWSCYSDAVVPERGFPVLAYGRLWAHFGLKCLSTRGGLLCTNARGRGFFVSREQQVFF